MEEKAHWIPKGQETYLVDGNTIDELREKRGLTQKQLCATDNYDPSTYTKLKHREIKRMGGSTLIAFAEELRVHPAALLDHSTAEFRDWVISNQGAIRASISLENLAPPTPTQCRDIDTIKRLIKEGHHRISLIGPTGFGVSTVLGGLQKSLAFNDTCYLILDQFATPFEMWNTLQHQLIPDRQSNDIDRFLLLGLVNTLCQLVVIDTGSDQRPNHQLLQTLCEFLAVPIVVGAERPVGCKNEYILPVSKVTCAADYVGFNDSDAWQIIRHPLSEQRMAALRTESNMVLIHHLASLCNQNVQAYAWLGEQLNVNEPADLLEATRKQSGQHHREKATHVINAQAQTLRNSLSPAQISAFRLLPKSFIAEDLNGIAGLSSSQIQSMLDTGVELGLLRQGSGQYALSGLHADSLHAQLQSTPFPVRDLVDHLTVKYESDTDQPAGIDVAGYVSVLTRAAESDQCNSNAASELASKYLDQLYFSVAHGKESWSALFLFVQAVFPKITGVQPIEYNAARYAAIACIYGGDSGAASYWVRQCEKLASSVIEKIRAMNLRATIPLSGTQLSEEDCRMSLRIFSEAAEIARKNNISISLTTILHNLAHAHELLDEIDEAVGCLVKAGAMIAGVEDDSDRQILEREHLINGCRLFARQRNWGILHEKLYSLQELVKKGTSLRDELPMVALTVVSLAVDQRDDEICWFSFDHDGSMRPPSEQTVRLAVAARIRNQIDSISPQYLERRTLSWISAHSDDQDCTPESVVEVEAEIEELISRTMKLQS